MEHCAQHLCRVGQNPNWPTPIGVYWRDEGVGMGGGHTQLKLIGHRAFGHLGFPSC